MLNCRRMAVTEGASRVIQITANRVINDHIFNYDGSVRPVAGRAITAAILGGAIMPENAHQAVERRPGHILCVSNPSMPGLIHIGITSRSVQQAMAELNAYYGEHPIIAHYELEWSEKVDDLLAIDLKLEHGLGAHKDTGSRSYFRCSAEHAHSVLASLLSQRVAAG